MLFMRGAVLPPLTEMTVRPSLDLRPHDAIGVVDGEHDHLLPRSGGQQHAIRRFTAQDRGLEVVDDDDQLANELLRLVMMTNSRDNLLLLVADVDLEEE